jgi:hypothetical protein
VRRPLDKADQNIEEVIVGGLHERFPEVRGVVKELAIKRSERVIPLHSSGRNRVHAPLEAGPATSPSSETYRGVSRSENPRPSPLPRRPNAHERWSPQQRLRASEAMCK